MGKRICGIFLILMILTGSRASAEESRTEPSGLNGESTNSSGNGTGELAAKIKRETREAMEALAAEAAKLAMEACQARLTEALREAERWEGEYRRIKKAAFRGKITIGIQALSVGFCLGAAATLIGGGGR